MNRYFLTDIPLVVSDDAEEHLIPRTSGFWPRREREALVADERNRLYLNRQDVELLRGKRSFAYHVMALMVRKEYGNISSDGRHDYVAAEWEHNPLFRKSKEIAKWFHSPIRQRSLQVASRVPCRAGGRFAMNQRRWRLRRTNGIEPLRLSTWQ